MKKIAVIGAGTMGNGITHVFAQFGFRVVMIDVSEAALEQALTIISKNFERQIEKGTVTPEIRNRAMELISTATSIQGNLNDCDLVVEAASENYEVKASIFRQLDEHAPHYTILASNTSSISITRIASETRRPGKVIGMHFMNPVPVMKLVEVINGYSTESEVTKQIMDLSVVIQKTPVEVNDYPGFVANRILMPMINEAIWTIHEGVAGITETDTVMKLGMAHPMGPLQLADFIGLDVCLSILKVIQDGFGNPKYAPCPLLINMVAAGNLGVKSGLGFYQYTKGSKETVVAPRFKK